MKVTEFKGHKVPEGATHFQMGYQDMYEGFYKKIYDAWFFFNPSSADGWVIESSANDSLHGCSIELPEQPMKSDEWVPVVGEECIVEYPYRDGSFQAFHGKKVTILGKCKDSDNCDVFTAHGSNGFIALNTLGFRPLKTAEEKKREAFINAAQACTEGTLFDNDDPEVVAFIDNLLKVGFTAPKGGE